MISVVDLRKEKMERTCNYCKHKEKSMGAEPCLDCVSTKCSENVVGRVYNNFEPVHSCGTCRYEHKKLSAEPCDSCDIRLGRNKWEAKDE